MEKYRLSFEDILGAKWDVSFFFDGFSGAYSLLQGAATPLEIDKNGDEDDLFSPVIKSQAKVNILMEDIGSFIDDISDINDFDISVRIQSNNGFLWYGYVVPDIRTENMNGPKSVSLLCIDLLSALNSSNTKTNVSYYISGKDTIYNILKNNINKFVPGWASISYIEINSITSSAGTLLSSYVYSDILYDDDGNIKNLLTFLSDVMKTFGMVCLQSKGNIYFISVLALSQHPGYTKQINFGGADNLLLGTENSWGKTRSIKKASASLTYNREGVSVFYNPYFIEYSNGFTGWESLIHNSLTGIEQVGEGTLNSPYAARIHGYSTFRSSDADKYPLFNEVYFKSQSTIMVKAGQTVTLKLKVRHPFTKYKEAPYGYEYSPYMQFALVLKKNISDFEIPYHLLNKYSDGDYYWDDSAFDHKGGIEMRSTILSDTQEFTVTTPPTTIDGYLMINIYPFFYPVKTENVNNGISATPVKDYFDVLSCLVTLSPLSEDSNYIYYNHNTSESHSLSSSGGATKYLDNVDAVVGNVPVIPVATNVLYAEDGNMKNNMFDADGTPLDNFTNGYNSYEKILRLVLKEKMYFLRQPRKIFYGKILSNTIYENNVLYIDNTNIFPLTDNYDVRLCTHDIVGQELKGVNAPDGDVFDGTEGDYYTEDISSNTSIYGAPIQ